VTVHPDRAVFARIVEQRAGALFGHAQFDQHPQRIIFIEVDGAVAPRAIGPLHAYAKSLAVRAESLLHADCGVSHV